MSINKSGESLKGGEVKMKIADLLPFLIPLIAAQLILLIFTIRHILTHEHYRRGNRVFWVILVLVGMQFWGPVLYFILGKEDA